MGIDYSPDTFNDPIVRCCDCQKLLTRQEVQEMGCCNKCGNRRVRNVLACDDAEMAWMKDKGIDPDFISLFQGIEGT